MVFARLMHGWRPTETVSAANLENSKRFLMLNGLGTQAMETLTLGTFLTAFALSLGAENVFIGLLAAAPHLASIGQLAGMYLVERFRNRRVISMIAGFISRPMLFLLALGALLSDHAVALGLVLFVILVRYCIGAIQGISWNSWIRDLIPVDQRGAFFSRRVRVMTIVGMVLGLATGLFLDRWVSFGLGPQKWAYFVIFTLAGSVGMVAVGFLARVSEPAMSPAPESPNILRMLRRPFQDTNFRNLMIFLAAWNFAVNLAAPFFTVHMFQRLELNVFTVTALATTSQITNILVLNTVGILTDRFSGKSVMSVSAPLLIICIFAWIFTTRPETATATLALLAGIHMVMGVATAGVTIASTTIAMRLAPSEHATAFMTANGLFSSAAAGIAPVIGGLTADFFADQKLSILIHWQGPVKELTLETFKVEHWDFFFLLAGLIGLYALHRLSLVKEEGSVDQTIVLTAFMAETKRTINNVSSVAGLRAATEWPFAIIQDLFRQRREN